MLNGKAKPGRCEIGQGSLVDQWSRQLDIEQAFDAERMCTSADTWEVTRNNMPYLVCNGHKNAMLAQSDTYTTAAPNQRMPYVIQEEPF